MSKELKPYERENLLIKQLRRVKDGRGGRIVQLNAVKKALKRCQDTYEKHIEAYAEDIKAREDSISKLDSKILDLDKQLKELKPKPKIKKKVILKPKNNGKVVCDICGKEYSKKGIKGHRRACVKKQEYEKAREEYEKLQMEETIEELEKEEPEIKLEETNEGD